MPFGFLGGNVPALNSAFMEYLDEAGEPRLADELAVGAEYRVVITTPGGLYRYDMGDRVLCTGHVGRAPLLCFIGRAGLVSDMVGEKLTDDFAASILADLPFTTMLAARLSPEPHYELLVDGEHNIDIAQIEARLRANPQYDYARKLGQLGSIRSVAKPGFAKALHDERLKQGSKLGNLKLQALLPLDSPMLTRNRLAQPPSGD